MRFKILLLIFITAILVMGNGFQPPLKKTPMQEHKLATINSGSINGLNYSYGSIDFSTSGNFTQSFNGSIVETLNDTRSGVRNIDLITNATHMNTLYKTTWQEERGNETFSYDEYYNQQTLDFFVNVTLGTIVPSRFNPLNSTDGKLQMKLNVTEAYSLETAYVISTTGKFLGQFPVNSTYLEYFHKYQNGTVTRRAGVIFPEVLIFDVQTKSYEVYVERTKLAISIVNYYVAQSFVYNVTAQAYQVRITNGENLGLEFNMFDRIQANYTHSIFSFVTYQFYSVDFTYLEFASNGTRNGTAVPFDMYPRNMLPITASSSGYFVEAGFQQVSTTAISTFQSITSLFVSKASNMTDMNQTNVEARLAIWGIQASTTMAAYEDGNGNGRFDLALTDDGLTIDSDDRLAYVGLGEAFQTTIVNGRYKESTYNSSVVFHGLGVSQNETNVSSNRTFFNVESFGYGDVNANTSADFRWNDPIVTDNGTVKFDFGITYNDFPVTWYNVSNPRNSVIDQETIGYNYVVLINPDTGFVKISPTWIYNGVTDPSLTSAMNGLSLSTVYKSEFFAAQALYTATESNETVPSSRSERFGRLAINTGVGQPTSEIDVTGPKANYTLNNVTYGAAFDAITLIQISGSFKETSVSPLESESADSAGTATVGSLVESVTVNFFYQSNLIVVSYDVWNGGSIVHDPDFNLNYEPTATAPTTTSTSPPSSSTIPPTTSTSPPATSSSTTTSSAPPTTSSPPPTSSNTTSDTTPSTTTPQATTSASPPETTSPVPQNTSADNGPIMALPLLMAVAFGVVILRQRKKN